MFTDIGAPERSARLQARGNGCHVMWRKVYGWFNPLGACWLAIVMALSNESAGPIMMSPLPGVAVDFRACSAFDFQFHQPLSHTAPPRSSCTPTPAVTQRTGIRYYYLPLVCIDW